MKTNPRLSAIVAIAASMTSMLAVQAAMAQDGPIDSITPVTEEMLLNPPDADWLMWRRTYDGWGFSPLSQITKDNVSQLRQVWRMPTDELKVHEAAPIVVGTSPI